MRTRKIHLLLAALLLPAVAAHAQIQSQSRTQAPSQTPGLHWQSSGAAQYVCGGVSDEDMSAIQAYRDGSNGELLLTGGPQGAYLANVAIVIHGKQLKTPLNFTAGGPVCLLKLPKGSYVVDASYNGVPLKQNLRIDGTHRKIQLRWPTE